MVFLIDDKISSTCFLLTDWPLSRVLLKNNADYPWLILVPRRERVQEIDQLSEQDRYQLMDEISKLSSIMRVYFKPDKLNIGALGNIVPALHIHVIARFKDDDLWPHGVWQESQVSEPYAQDVLEPLLMDLKLLV